MSLRKKKAQRDTSNYFFMDFDFWMNNPCHGNRSFYVGKNFYFYKLNTEEIEGGKNYPLEFFLEHRHDDGVRWQIGKLQNKMRCLNRFCKVIVPGEIISVTKGILVLEGYNWREKHGRNPNAFNS